MYRRRRSTRGTFIRLILLGIFSGLVFLVYDNLRQPVSAPPVAEPIATAVPTLTAEAPEPTATEAPASTPTPPAVANGVTTGRDFVSGSTLFIPAAGVFAPITRVYLDGFSWDVSNLGLNVGHLQGTAWMDSGPGNIVLSAHVEMRDGSGGPFSTLHELAVGDLIILRRGEDERRYSVIEVYSVEPDDLTPVYPTTSERLTLITCDDYDFFRDMYATRTVVVAERLG
jgi:LPXTG-site transpeptidase (sortase) family protein